MNISKEDLLARNFQQLVTDKDYELLHPSSGNGLRVSLHAKGKIVTSIGSDHMALLIPYTNTIEDLDELIAAFLESNSESLDLNYLKDKLRYLSENAH